MGKPFVSVLIDTYNHERFIEEAIVSALEQDFPSSDREILVVDDGSTDRTPDIIRKFEPHVRLLRKENGGQASAFNAGIPECRGEIIAFLDGDDWWETRKLSGVVAEFGSHPNVGTVGHGFTEVDEDGKPLAVVATQAECESRLGDLKEVSDFLTLRAFLGTSRLAIRKEILRQVGSLPAGLEIEADEFLATVATALGGALFLTEPLTNYRYHSENLFQFHERDAAIEAALRTYKLRCAKLEDSAGAAAELLSQGKILGWFQGRMEFGPRALGSRSILADPRDPEMNAKVNNAVKFREWWRPFAPSLKKEAAGEYLESAADSPFMILTAQVRPEKRGVIPAVTHVDGSARPQTVEKDINPLYWRLIDEFGKRTGVPVIMNTSLNLCGEAIVHTPTDAIRTFFSSGMDALVIGSFLVEK